LMNRFIRVAVVGRSSFRSSFVSLNVISPLCVYYMVVGLFMLFFVFW